MSEPQGAPAPLTLPQVIISQQKLIETNFQQMLWTLISTATLYRFTEDFKSSIIRDVIGLAELISPKEMKEDGESNG